MHVVNIFFMFFILTSFPTQTLAKSVGDISFSHEHWTVKGKTDLFAAPPTSNLVITTEDTFKNAILGFEFKKNRLDSVHIHPKKFEIDRHEIDSLDIIFKFDDEKAFSEKWHTYVFGIFQLIPKDISEKLFNSDTVLVRIKYDDYNYQDLQFDLKKMSNVIDVLRKEHNIKLTIK